MKLQEPVELILRKKGSQVHDIAPDLTVYEALEQMVQNDVGALVVMDGTELVGLISERDYARKVILKGRSSKEMRVSDIMSTPPCSVSGRTTVDECMRMMTEERCRHVVVVEDGSVVGVISLGDLINWIITTQELTIHHLHEYIRGRHPGGADLI